MACRVQRRLAKLLSEERDHAMPGVASGFRTIGLGSRVVHEGMSCVGVDHQLAGLARCGATALELANVFGRDEGIVRPEEPQQWTLQSGCRSERRTRLFRWIESRFPGGRLYGPYHHGGRSYFQWMARGRFLRDELLPLLDKYLSPEIDRKSYDRLQAMKARYRL